MLSKIFLDTPAFTEYKTIAGDKILADLSRINIFIGKNNSGKSRLLRNLFYDENVKFQLKVENYESLVKILKELLANIESFLSRAQLQDVQGISTPSIKGQLAQLVEISGKHDFISLDTMVENVVQYLNALCDFKLQAMEHKPTAMVSISNEYLQQEMRVYGEQAKIQFNALQLKPVKYKPHKVYIPMLRGLRPLTQEASIGTKKNTDHYHSRTTKDYFPGTMKDNSFIFTGLSLYDDIRKMLLSKQADRNAIREFEKWIGDSFFNGDPFTLIPNIDDDSLHVLMDIEEQPVYKVGDGIQSLIILLYPLFMNRDKAMLVYIEEPENGLLPGLQRLFLETILSDKFPNFQYFFSTHSNHFLDITLDIDQISIFTLDKLKMKNNENIFQIENCSNERFKSLDLIGVRNASVFLSNCTIWVEGITDRYYIKKFLQVYQEHLLAKRTITNPFREDYHFSFVEYSGANITHWSFTSEPGADEKIAARRVASKILLIADNDDYKNKEYKQNRFAELQKQLGKDFIVLKSLEIENTLSFPVIEQAIKKLAGDKGDVITVKSSNVAISNYQKQKLGHFIQKNFTGLNRKYADAAGSVFPKLDFCKAAV